MPPAHNWSRSWVASIKPRLMWTALNNAITNVLMPIAAKTYSCIRSPIVTAFSLDRETTTLQVTVQESHPMHSRGSLAVKCACDAALVGHDRNTLRARRVDSAA